VKVNGYPDQNGYEIIIMYYIENIAEELAVETFLERVR